MEWSQHKAADLMPRTVSRRVCQRLEKQHVGEGTRAYGPTEPRFQWLRRGLFEEVEELRHHVPPGQAQATARRGFSHLAVVLPHGPLFYPEVGDTPQW